MHHVTDVLYYICNVIKINMCHLMKHYFNIPLDSWEQYVAMETYVCLVISIFFILTQEFEYNVILPARIKLAIIHLKIKSRKSKQTHGTNGLLSSHKLSLNYALIIDNQYGFYIHWIPEEERPGKHPYFLGSWECIGWIRTIFFHKLFYDFP